MIIIHLIISPPMNKGIKFEKKICKLFERLGKKNIKHNVQLRDKFGNLSQIDVVYGYFFKTYIECKFYHQDHAVPFEDVAKFKQVLILNNINPSRGIFITTSYFTPRCSTIGIKTIDGEELKKLENLSIIKKRFQYLFYITMMIYIWYMYKDDIINLKIN